MPQGNRNKCKTDPKKRGNHRRKDKHLNRRVKLNIKKKEIIHASQILPLIKLPISFLLSLGK